MKLKICLTVPYCNNVTADHSDLQPFKKHKLCTKSIENWFGESDFWMHFKSMFKCYSKCSNSTFNKFSPMVICSNIELCQISDSLQLLRWLFPSQIKAFESGMQLHKLPTMELKPSIFKTARAAVVITVPPGLTQGKQRGKLPPRHCQFQRQLVWDTGRMTRARGVWRVKSGGDGASRDYSLVWFLVVWFQSGGC